MPSVPGIQPTSLHLPSLPGSSADPRFGAFANMLRQQAAYAMPSARDATATGYLTALQRMGGIRPPGVSGFGAPAPRWR